MSKKASSGYSTRLISGAVLLLSTVALASCDLPLRPADPLHFENASTNIKDNRDYRYLSSYELFLDEDTYSLCADYQDDDAIKGYLILKKNDTGLYGALSLKDGSILVAFMYTSIATIDTTDNGSYLRCYNSDGTSNLYDYRGYMVDITMPADANVSVSTIKGYISNSVNPILVEKITCGEVTISNEVHEDGTRTSYVLPIELLTKDSTSGDYIETMSPLDEVDLPGYSGSIASDGHVIVFKGEGAVSEFDMPSFDKGTFLHKAFLYQKSEAVSDGDSYDYTDGTTNYSLLTNQIELVTGNTNELSCNYLISDIKGIYNKDHVKDFAVVEAKPIVDKTLGDDKLYVIDNEGNIRKDVTDDPQYSFDLEYADWDCFYSSTNKMLIDTEFNKTVDIPEESTPIYAERQFLIKSDSLYGIYGYDGEEVIAPTYERLYALNQNDHTYIGYKSNTYYSVNSSTKDETALDTSSYSSINVINDSLLKCQNADGTYTYLYPSGNTVNTSVNADYKSENVLSTFFTKATIDYYSTIDPFQPKTFFSFWI